MTLAKMVFQMTLKETLLRELETADDELITATLAWVRSRKNQAAMPPSNSEPIQRQAKLGDLLEFANTWAGNDLEDCLESFYSNRSQTNFAPSDQPFEQ